MFDAESILETINMIKVNKLDIRTVTLSLSLRDCAHSDIKIVGENIRNKIINDYFINLNKSQPPIVISSQSGERLSGVQPDSPKTLAEAKKQLEKLFS